MPYILCLYTLDINTFHFLRKSKADECLAGCRTVKTGRLLSRDETHDAVDGSFINLMKLRNVETLIFLVPASNHFFICFDVVLVMKGCLL